MTDSVKLAITKAVLEQLPDISQYNLEHALGIWWYRPSGRGLRLTVLGDHCFQLADIEFFVFSVDTALQLTSWSRFVLDLTNKITCPYFISSDSIRKPFIRIYDSKVAMMINLYGDLNDYINQTSSKRK